MLISELCVRRIAVSTAQPLCSGVQRRALHVSRTVFGEHAPSSAAQTAEYPQEGFNSSLWKYGILAGVGIFSYYRFAGAAKRDSEEESPVTQYISGLITPTSELASANQEHLDWSLKKADAQLLVQDAQKPPAHQMMYLPAFEQYPSRNLPVGGMIDVSNMKLNPERV